MSETLLAHFKHGWEAEFARGFLDEAGIPCRVFSDAQAGGHPYAGGLAGASLSVAEFDAARAHAVLEDAGVLGPGGVLQEGGGAASASTSGPLPPVLQADLDDVNRQLRRARRKEMGHFVRSMLGITPAALIPIVGLALRGEVALVALVCVSVVFVEGWRWIQAGREVRRLEDMLTKLERQADRLPPPS
ncbi:MAG: DUF2007 domain-containing protein [Gemmatimonadota bacterium]|jgi:hypothetical protein